MIPTPAESQSKTMIAVRRRMAAEGLPYLRTSQR